MGSIIKALELETGKTCFDTYRRCLDHERASLIEDDEFSHEFMKEQGETERFSGARNIQQIALDWQERQPAFRLFMDGSRRTYKIADMPIGSQVFPIIAGQVGVAVCKREDRVLSACRFTLHVVLAVPDKLDTEGKNEKQHRAFLANLVQKLNVNQDRVKLDAVLLYPTRANENFEDKGIARIQEYMIEQEKEMVQSLVQAHLINDRSWLIKDGSLEYNRLSDKDDRFAFNRIRSNYKRVVGVSKSFNPELAKLKNGRSAAGMIAQLQPFERTPAAMYQTDRVDGKFAVWYVRLRSARKSRGPFDGIVKVEKILVSDRELEYGLETSEVDNISAWLMNERNPVCYGKDDRWANHLYPVYLTETFIKSKYRGTAHFINLF
jgi:hypothetical protein